MEQGNQSTSPALSLKALREAFEEYKAKGLSLDMSRGKPAPDQLDLSLGMTTILTKEDFQNAKIDVRNYGLLDGLPEMKALFADILEIEPEEVFIGGNSSLNLMYDTVQKAMQFGLPGGEKPWKDLPSVKFLCPVPGYDRHFAVTEAFGIEMINIPMTEEGPDMDLVQQYVENDPSVKGIWCVPKYSNPSGITYSDETVRRFAALKPAAKDFRIFWDNAYCVHHLTDTPDHLLNLMAECKKRGSEDMVMMFTSTSKISFSGAGIAAFACSKTNMDYLKKLISFQTIGFDKINQLRHLKFFKNKDGITEHMKKHRALIEPKFNLTLSILEKELTGIARWHKPNGGYFISVDVPKGCAKRTVALCKEAGVVLTGAGATFPYGKDPNDENIRLAPTYPDLDSLKQAMEIFCLCVKLAAAEKESA